uniref:VWFA domain-containing protein n=1 Tax=Syphacia muris TaxID=451379 RepID=A0A0N5AE05_9BILA
MNDSDSDLIKCLTLIKFLARCIVQAAPLDLVFILDSSGSLKNKFQDETDIIRRIVKHVTIGDSATRVMLIQFSGVQHLEFNFNKFTNRDDILSALDVLRHVSGITRVGGAFEFAISKMTPENGMRPSNVPKIVYLLSDGRTHDFPKDSEMADLMRKTIPNIDIWAYGTGDYVAWNELVNITKDPKRIITNKNLDQLEPLFDPWKGVEVCEERPVCIKGSDKPLDLALLIDSSESVDRLFDDQIRFAIERIVQNVNIHPDAVRLALITFSGQAFVHFKFNDYKYGNNSAVIRYLNTLRSIKGTTSTHLALQMAYELFTNRDGDSGAREGVPKLAIVMTDGHSQRSPRNLAHRLRAEGIELFAISLTSSPYVDEAELLFIAQDERRVFTPSNEQEFEAEFLKYVGFGCPGYDLGVEAQPRVRGATDVSCGPNSVTFTVRTQKPMTGLMYAQQYHDDPKCVKVTDGSSREVSITFVEGTCGLSKTASFRLDGYSYNITVILQFHPLIITRADQGLSVSCFHPQPISLQDIGHSSLKKVTDTECSYRLHRFNPDECVALDAKVGESLYHKWECDSPPNYHYLIHDCYVKSETKNFKILDSDGCEIDPHFLEVPDYSKFYEKPRKGDAYVFKEMSVFKFPGDYNVIFQCKISLCDMESGAPCTQMIPPKCSGRSPEQRNRRSLPDTKDGFSMTINVETRTLNVLENESIRPPIPIKYCDIRL